MSKPDLTWILGPKESLRTFNYYDGSVKCWPLGPDGLTSIERELADAKARIAEAVTWINDRSYNDWMQGAPSKLIDILQPKGGAT